jgi:hypothetical protein
LFQERGILHITPGVASSLNGQFNETQMTDNVIEDKTIIEVTTRLISIFRKPVEIKMYHKQPDVTPCPPKPHRPTLP